MSQKSVTPAESLRLYSSRFTGPILLVCRKCEKRFKKSSTGPIKLKKIFKRLQRKDPNPQPIYIISTSCMNLCPKDGITVCPQSQLRESQPGLIILRTKTDAKLLYSDQKRRHAT